VEEPFLFIKRNADLERHVAWLRRSGVDVHLLLKQSLDSLRKAGRFLKIDPAQTEPLRSPEQQEEFKQHISSAIAKIAGAGL
jgi:hypothetical protein